MRAESWRQWIATLGPMILTALGVAFWVVGAINGLHDEITVARQEQTKIISEVMQKVMVDEGRITQLDKAIEDSRAASSAFRSEMHTSLTQLFTLMGDMRVAIARDGGKGK